MSALPEFLWNIFLRRSRRPRGRSEFETDFQPPNPIRTEPARETDLASQQEWL